jgi:hypothetical protein
MKYAVVILFSLKKSIESTEALKHHSAGDYMLNSTTLLTKLTSPK